MDIRKRIILLTPSMSKGGAESQLLKIARFLQTEDHKVLLISMKGIDEFDGALQECGCDLLFLNNWIRKPFSNVNALCRTIDNFKPDVVLAFMFVAIIAARVMKLRTNFKLISSIRISVIPAKWYVPFRMTSGLDDVIVYNSLAAKQHFEKKNLCVRGGRIIKNGISISNFKPKAQLANLPFKWICIGHFRWNKDYKTLFRAVALIKHHDFQLNILGKPDGEQWPEEMINSLGISSHVNLLGFKSDPRSFLEDANAFVLSSFSEGMPNAVLEAMALAKPVVVTDIDGNHELVTKAACGFLCESENEHAMATAMLKIMEMSDAKRFMLGERGREYVCANFAEDQVMKRWMQLINETTCKQP
ncbi:glycosyltransferase [Pedobacter sp. MC2016-24]|uniref:glycosyltransferase n=1 Tax=Pedobacter sp. MC2016-24 TaxID=2780090 RepID=UPI0018800D21|nr:glycosyltransferase [Pedobacter sp. MC2016-24]MBE9601662.1 glycosyltransferase [Pedobacter sp. MC2016-24]